MINVDKYPLNIIVAVDEAGGFAKESKIPWNCSEDMKYFKEVTNGGICIMGHGTYCDMVQMTIDRGKEIGDHILPGRTSFVLTSQDIDFDGATRAGSISEALNTLPDGEDRKVFILGGRRLFIEAIGLDAQVHMTIIKGIYYCDQSFPIDLLNRFYKITDGHEGEECDFVIYDRVVRPQARKFDQR